MIMKVKSHLGGGKMPIIVDPEALLQKSVELVGRSQTEQIQEWLADYDSLKGTLEQAKPLLRVQLDLQARLFRRQFEKK
jgi:hypothetical protein